MASVRAIFITGICGVITVYLAWGSFQGERARQARFAPAVVDVESPYVPNADSVGFEIAPVSGERSTSEWIATYRSQGKTAKFRIVLGTGTSLEDGKVEGLQLKSGEGRFVAEVGSDASILVADLKKALQAKALPRKVKRVASLPFTFVSFGQKQSRFADGGYAAHPPGNWVPMKIFIGDGEQECEVFLGLNPVLGMGEFSIKDEEYGNGVVASLASVL